MAANFGGQSAVTATVASSASSVTLFPASGSARMRMVFNESSAILYIKFGTTASLTDYTVQVAAGGYYEFAQPFYGGRVDAIWAAANGNARTTSY